MYIANIALLLASNAPRTININGAVIPADGGISAID
jgi:hypothetical protein